MNIYVKKRSGLIEAFQIEKLIKSILRAGTEVQSLEQAAAQSISEKILNKIKQDQQLRVISVEMLHQAAADVLCEQCGEAVARAYESYTHGKHAKNGGSHKSVDSVTKYVSQMDWKVNENSNTAYSLQGLNNYVTSEAIQDYWLNKIYPADIRNATIGGDIHIHDLQSLSTYCVGWDLQDLLRVGFKGAPDKIESKPAKHLRTALGQLVNFFYTLQGESAGAQAVSSFDTLLAPFIRYDKLTHKEVKQALQEFMFNMNVPTRVGFQTPFTNVTLDLFPPKILANEHVIIGGEPQKETYAAFQEEMNLFNKVFTEVIDEGDARGRVFTFPIPTYNITADFDWDNPVLENLWHMTAKYGIPYFSNFVNSDMNPEDARSMCCRLRLDNRELRKRGGGLFGANPLTGSVGVVTVNLPRIGYLAKSEAEFFSRLTHVMDLAKQSLEIKRDIIESFTDKNLYPYSKFYLRAVKERLGHFWANHFSTIGIVGMNEACLNLLGVSVGSIEGQRFGNAVLDFMRDRMQHYQNETGNYYNLEATPAESTAYRLAQKDKERYPDIIVANEQSSCNDQLNKCNKEVIAAPFYTNSSHLPVNYTSDIFELLDLQDELQTKYTGGTVVHIFLGEEVTDCNAVKALVKTICHKYKLPYFTLTPTFSVCPNHGYLAGKKPNCPTCGEETNVYSRIVGYIRPTSQWNKGKKAEFEMRNTYDLVMNKVVAVRHPRQEPTNEMPTV